MKRRFFLNALSAVGTTLSLKSFAKNTTLKNKIKKSTPHSMMTGSDSNLDLKLKIVAGSFPLQLSGHFFFVEAERPSPKSNLLAGKGFLNRVDFDSTQQKVYLKRRIIETPSKIAADKLANTSHAFVQSGFIQFHNELGVVNHLNTAITEIANHRLLLTTDVGIPYEFDTETLELKTPAGSLKEWKQSLPHELPMIDTEKMPFPMVRTTAHPAVDLTSGEFFSVNHGGQLMIGPVPLGKPFTKLIKWNGTDLFKTWEVLNAENKPVKIREAAHTLCVTEHHVVIVDTPFHLEMGQIFGLSVSGKQPDNTVVWVILRSDLIDSNSSVVARSVTLPREWQHVAALWNSTPNELEIVGAANACSDFSEWLQLNENLLNGSKVTEDFAGMIPSAVDLSFYGSIKFTIDDNIKPPMSAIIKWFTDEKIVWMPALQTFPTQMGRPLNAENFYWINYGYKTELTPTRIFNLYKDYKYRTIDAQKLKSIDAQPSLSKFNGSKNKIEDVWFAPEGIFISSPQFIPKSIANTAEEGYIAVTLYSDEQGDRLAIFDAQNLSQGPICELAHENWNFSLSLHCHWLPQIKAWEKEYFVPASADFGPRIESRNPEIKEVFEKHIYTRFG